MVDFGDIVNKVKDVGVAGLGPIVGPIVQGKVPDFGTGGKGDTAAATPSTTTPPATTPAAGGVQGMNPLAVNLFYSQAIAPMMKQLAGQLQGANADFTKQMQANPMAQFVPPQLQAIFNQQNARQGAEQNNLVTSMMNSAMNAPALDSLMQQVTSGRQAALQDYERMLYAQNAGTLGGSPYGNPTDAQAQVDAATQKIQAAGGSGG